MQHLRRMQHENRTFRTFLTTPAVSMAYGLVSDICEWQNAAVTRGDSIEARRLSVDWSQEQLAAAAKMNRSTVIRAESDDKRVKARTFQRLERALTARESVLGRHTSAASSLNPEGASTNVVASSVVAQLQSILTNLVKVITQLEAAGALRDPLPPDRSTTRQRHR